MVPQRAQRSIILNILHVCKNKEVRVKQTLLKISQEHKIVNGKNRKFRQKRKF